MTTTDARKRNRDMADAHATARARDAYRTRTQAIDPETGTFTPLTQEPDMTDHRAHAERALDAIDDSDDPRNLPAGLDGIGRALLAIHGTLAEIRDRLPERTEVKVAPFDPDLVAANIAALKHELETPMRGHGECCEPAPTDDLPGEPVEVEPEKTHPCPGCGTFTGKRVCNSCWGTSDDPEAGYSQAECIEDVPAPADDGLAEWERELLAGADELGQLAPFVRDGLVDPRGVAGLVRGPGVLLHADGDGAEGDRGLGGALAEGDDLLGLLGDLGGAERALDRHGEGAVPAGRRVGVRAGVGAAPGEGERGGEQERGRGRAQAGQGHRRRPCEGEAGPVTGANVRIP